MRKKIITFVSFFLITLSISAETVFTFSTASDMSQTKDGITLSIAKGDGGTAPTVTTDYETGTPEMRLYLGNTITISSSTALTNIQLVCAKSSASNKQYTGLSASTGDLQSGGVAEDKNDWKVDSWTGSATSVVFTLTEKGQRRIQKIVIDGAPVVIETQSTTLPTAEDLQSDYEYPEPTIVNAPDTQFFKNEYAFISNNILVHCSQGSIIKATDTTYAYFNCNAESSLTFTATKPIKGISIDGFVRKDFNATCAPGEIQYLTDPDQDMEGWPALVIRNIDSTSVTISCPKQLRVYSLKVYFQENPDPIEEAVADTTDLHPVSAVAMDYSETEWSEEGHYSYWIKLSSENQYPEIWLDIYSATKGDLSGWYSPYAYNTGDQTYVWFSDGDTDAVTAYDIDVTIEKKGNGYTIDGVLTCWERGYEYSDEGEDLIYRFSYEGPVRFDLPEGVETIPSSSVETRKVLRSGQLLILRGDKLYNALGIEL